MRRLRIGIGIGVAGALFGACSGGGSTLPVADAAAAVDAAVDQGDSLGGCPFGDTGALLAGVDDAVPLNDGFAGGVEDNGQVFSGGEVDITYCGLVPDPFAQGDIDEVRLDAASGTVDLDTYLTEEWVFDAGDVSIEQAGDLAGGSLRTGCWSDGTDVCGAFWQADGLFVAVVALGDVDVTRDHAEAIARAVIPGAVENLAA
jgi:hypothetical protein